MERNIVPFVDRVIRIRGAEIKSPEVRARELLREGDLSQAQVNIVAPYKMGLFVKSDELDIIGETEETVLKKEGNIFHRRPSVVRAEQRWTVEEKEPIDDLYISYNLNLQTLRDKTGKSLESFQMSITHRNTPRSDRLDLNFTNNLLSTITLRWAGSTPETMQVLSKDQAINEFIEEFYNPSLYDRQDVRDGSLSLELGTKPGVTIRRSDIWGRPSRSNFLYDSGRNKFMRSPFSPEEVSWNARFKLSQRVGLASEEFLEILQNSLSLIPATVQPIP